MATRKPKASPNGTPTQAGVSELGLLLRKLRAKHEAAGGKFLNRRELEREIADRRGLR
ncbi:MAG: hypothetical protein NTZ56_14825 [Acidobacteria bacterium]|nr:hypothetical protein [Acidobacteriota bacterium]